MAAITSSENHLYVASGLTVSKMIEIVLNALSIFSDFVLLAS